MTTQAQIDANRRNAQKSTGPRTDPGKAAVRQNALRHGYCATMCLSEDEPEKEFLELQDLLREENQPLGANEEILVHMMAIHFHNFCRADEALCAALEGSVRRVPPGYKPSPLSIPLALRYQQTAFRSFTHGLTQLRKLQKDRRIADNESKPIPVDTPLETPAEAPVQASKPAPPAANPPSPPPIPVPAAISHLVEPLNRIDNQPASPSQQPPKAA